MPQDTKFKIEEYLTWTSMLIYAAVWFLAISSLLAPQLILVAALTSATYVGCQVYEILKNGNCYIWADRTAAPVSFGVLLTVVLFHFVFGYWSWELESFFPVALYTLALMSGHLIAISFSTAMNRLLNLMLRTESEQ